MLEYPTANLLRKDPHGTSLGATFFRSFQSSEKHSAKSVRSDPSPKESSDLLRRFIANGFRLSSLAGDGRPYINIMSIDLATKQRHCPFPLSPGPASANGHEQFEGKEKQERDN